METPKLKSVIRLDSVPLAETYFTPEGFLRDKPILTSTGIFEYMNPNGSVRRELRLPEDVFNPESLKSYKGKPIIITHDAGLINKNNVSSNQVGTILSEGIKDGQNVRAEIIIHDTDEMKKAGLKELSLGYNLDLEETEGEWNGQHYDAIQRNIRVNHLALVREARAGEQARLNIDSRDNENALKGGKTMGASKTTRNTRRTDGVLSKEEFAKAIDEYKQRKAQREATDAEDVVEEEIKETPDTIESKVAEVKANRDRRDEDGDPRDEEEALGVIARQDEDLDTLFDIIDTLLAERDFDSADETMPEETKEEAMETIPEEEKGEDKVAVDGCGKKCVKGKCDGNKPVDGVDDVNKLNGDVEDLPEDEEEMMTDADDEEVMLEEEEVKDADDVEDIVEGEEDETLIDADDVLLEEEEEVKKDACGEEEEDKLNMDSVDMAISRGIRDHMIMGKLGRAVGVKNLEFKDVKTAKKVIISRVRPDMRLDGKTDTYINAAFDMAKKEIKSMSKKDTSYQKKQMFNKDSKEVVGVKGSSAANARQKMIERMHKK